MTLLTTFSALSGWGLTVTSRNGPFGVGVAVAIVLKVGVKLTSERYVVRCFVVSIVVVFMCMRMVMSEEEKSEVNYVPRFGRPLSEPPFYF